MDAVAYRTTELDANMKSKTDVQLTFEGEFNPMMEMIIKGPISKFIETLSQNIVKL